MARQKKFRKDEAVTVNGWQKVVTRDQYAYRGKQVVDVKDGEGTDARVPVANVKRLDLASFAEPIDCGPATVTALPMNKYQRQIINYVGESIVVDVYDVLNAFGVTDPATAHAIKKLLAPGQRGSKSVVQDLNESIQSVERAIDRQHNLTI